MKRPIVCPMCSVNNAPNRTECITCQAPLGDQKGLFLHEELVLFVLDDESGAVTSQGGFAYKYGIGGAVMTELLLAGLLQLDDSGKHPMVQVVNGPSPKIEDLLLQEVFEMIRDHAKPRKMSEWVTKVAGLKDLPVRVALPLCDLGVLEHRERERGFLFFKYTEHRYPMLDPTAEYAAVNRVRKAIREPGAVRDERTALLVALANAGRVLSIRFADEELKENKDRIDNITAESGIGETVRETIAAIESAIVMATIAASTAASSAAAAG